MYIQFFRGEINHPRGFSISDILAWDDEEWERNHDFIQWVFPTFQKSAFNPDIPELTKKDVEIFRKDTDLQLTFDRVIERFLKFLDYKRNEKPWWFHEGNHNLLRITRALDSSKTLSEAGRHYEILNWLRDLQDENPGIIPKRTSHFWEQAVK
jgi:hypothetical protein